MELNSLRSQRIPHMSHWDKLLCQVSKKWIELDEIRAIGIVAIAEVEEKRYRSGKGLWSWVSGLSSQSGC